MKQFFRQYGRLTLALAAVLAFCAVLPTEQEITQPAPKTPFTNEKIHIELPDGGPAARRQRVKGGAAAL